MAAALARVEVARLLLGIRRLLLTVRAFLHRISDCVDDDLSPYRVHFDLRARPGPREVPAGSINSLSIFFDLFRVVIARVHSNPDNETDCECNQYEYNYRFRAHRHSS